MKGKFAGLDDRRRRTKDYHFCQFQRDKSLTVLRLCSLQRRERTRVRGRSPSFSVHTENTCMSKNFDETVHLQYKIRQNKYER